MKGYACRWENFITALLFLNLQLHPLISADMSNINRLTSSTRRSTRTSSSTSPWLLASHLGHQPSGEESRSWPTPRRLLTPANHSQGGWHGRPWNVSTSGVVTVERFLVCLVEEPARFAHRCTRVEWDRTSSAMFTEDSGKLYIKLFVGEQ